MGDSEYIINRYSIMSYINPTPPLQDTTCVICFDHYTTETSIHFPCSHQICLVCYEKLINRHDILHCPLCREVVEIVQEITHEPEERIRIETPTTMCTWCAAHGSQIICYLFILGGICTLFIK
jgi:hypothetical protein